MLERFIYTLSKLCCVRTCFVNNAHKLWYWNGTKWNVDSILLYAGNSINASIYTATLRYIQNMYCAYTWVMDRGIYIVFCCKSNQCLVIFKWHLKT